MNIPHFTKAQKRAQDRLFRSAENSQKCFSENFNTNLEFQSDSGVRYSYGPGSCKIGVSDDSITKQKKFESKIPDPECKVEHYTTTDQEGRTWYVERRH